MFLPTRRAAIKTMAAAASIAALSNRKLFGGIKDSLSAPSHSAVAAKGEGHFFLYVHLSNGVDWSYVCDARPLQMTADGKIQNYSETEPIPWTDSHSGNETWVTESFNRTLGPLRDYFSIVNGVICDPMNVGHGQNRLFLLCGRVAGGRSFLTDVPTAATTPFGYIQTQATEIDAQVTDGNIGVTLTPQIVRQLIDQAKMLDTLNPPGDGVDPVSALLKENFAEAALVSGEFGVGARLTHDALMTSQILQDSLSQGAPPQITGDYLTDALQSVSMLFRHGLSKSAFIPLPGGFDTHSALAQRGYPALGSTVAAQIRKIVDTLRTNAFDETRSLLDVTTICITSEFGRTMRQLGVTIDNSGTDHNNLCNSFILAGKSIATGQIVGQSDFRSSPELLSGAHLSRDRFSLHTMGRPFDFATQTLRADLPLDFSIKNYLSAPSVINTMLQAMGAPQSVLRKYSAFGTVAPTIQSILI